MPTFLCGCLQRKMKYYTLMVSGQIRCTLVGHQVRMDSYPDRIYLRSSPALPQKRALMLATWRSIPQERWGVSNNSLYQLFGRQ